MSSHDPATGAPAGAPFQAGRLCIACILSSLLAACTVGPDYVRPSPPHVPSFVRQEAAQDNAPRPADEAFWRSFGDPFLEHLVGAALLHNHDLRIALANYRQADALLGQARLERLPTLTTNVEASDASPDGSNYQVNLGAIWELDFFGRMRRATEAQRAEAEASAAELAAMQVVVVGELARTYFELRGLQEQLRVARASAHSQFRTQQLLEVRHEAGVGSGFDVDRGRAQMEGIYARLPALEAEVAFAAHRIAVLTGLPPGSLVEELDLATGLPPVPAQDMDAGTPGELLRRRPDVIAAERRLAAATARIGVATADLFPRFTLSGLIGTGAVDAGALFRRDSETRLLALGVGGDFLNVGRIRARIAAADASAAAYLAAYERAVLGALEETENALIRVSRSERELSHLQHAADASARAVAVARARLDVGAIDLLEVLDAERTNLLSQEAHAQGLLRHAQARVLLFRTLAGGWSNAMTEAPESVSQQIKEVTDSLDRSM